jgi:hypothetical protein
MKFRPYQMTEAYKNYLVLLYLAFEVATRDQN